MSVQDMQKQIESINNTAKMTGAMQTISAVKLSRARERLDRIRPYTDNMQEMMRDIASAGGDNPLLVGREEVNTVAICTITSDRGLAGAFNAQALRRTMALAQEQSADVMHVVSGRKAVEFFRFQRTNVEEAYTGFSDNPSYEKAREIGHHLTQLFQDEEADEVHLVYNEFQNALVQNPIAVRLLPVGSETGEEDEEEEGEEEGGGAPFEFVPGPEELLDRLVPKYVETLMFRALYESAAGEHGARMSAMKAATDSANEMAEDLQQQMNKMRQAAITQEIIEIAAAAEALGG